MKPDSKAMAMPSGKLKSFTAAFFSASVSDWAFMAPATPMMAMPASVMTTPVMTAKVSAPKAPRSGKNTLSSTGPMTVPRAAQVPRAIDWPRATPR